MESMKLKAHWKPLVKSFKTECHNKSDEIDPDDELDWYDLTVGWAVAKGLRGEDARDFATYIRYSTDLG